MVGINCVCACVCVCVCVCVQVFCTVSRAQKLYMRGSFLHIGYTKLPSPVLPSAVLLFPHVGRDLDKTTASSPSLIFWRLASPRDWWGRRRGRVCFQCKRWQLTSFPSQWGSGDAWQRCTARGLHLHVLSGGANLCLDGWEGP